MAFLFVNCEKNENKKVLQKYYVFITSMLKVLTFYQIKIKYKYI